MESTRRNFRTVCRTQHVYMDVSLRFEEPGEEVDATMFKFIIQQALRTSFGEVGASVNVDVLKFREADLRAYLRVLSSNLVRLWSSLTLTSCYNGRPCSFRVYKVSPSLASLAVSSSHYQHVPAAKTTAHE
ncbi:ribonuclease P protein subunit p14 [Rhipicephalus sanguineus]|uniref:ribonuclease P protein subunit p14 n=1 Tax=Rhipicephalus sanguineus TaxID=34632 RepID=UPI001896110E|nr:ribonuclease P protein subunit p14 [Rhipicephalus sanguineus]